jgi:hypothetical protein
VGYLIDLPVFASLSRWRAILASLERIEDKDESVDEAIRRCRQEIGRMMARSIGAVSS